MLDFFLLSDEYLSEQPLGDIPDEIVTCVGGIKMKEFEEAQVAEIIESSLDFYEDFRWSFEQVERKLALLAMLNHPFLTNLRLILEQAVAANSGLIALCD